MTERQHRCPKTILVTSAKGGVGKTATATGLTGRWAAEGRRVLLCDLDPQASATRALNIDPAATRQGKGLVETLAAGGSLRFYDSPGRPNLGVIPAGMYTRRASRHLVRAADGQQRFVEAFAELDDRFDAIVFDSGPTVMGNPLNELVMRSAEFLIAPCSASEEDLAGLAGLGEVSEALESGIVLLGVVLMRIPAAATRRRAETVAAVTEMLDGYAAPFGTIVRDAPAAWNAAMRKGMLPHEYGRQVVPGRGGAPRNAAALASDIEDLAVEVWNRYQRGRELLSRAVAA